MDSGDRDEAERRPLCLRDGLSLRRGCIPPPTLLPGHRLDSPSRRRLDRTAMTRIGQRPRCVVAFAQVSRPQRRRGPTESSYPCPVYVGRVRPAFPQVRPCFEPLVAGEGSEPSKLSRRIYRWTVDRLWPAVTPRSAKLGHEWATDTRRLSVTAGHIRIPKPLGQPGTAT
jgi:hypothetical protein